MYLYCQSVQQDACADSCIKMFDGNGCCISHTQCYCYITGRLVSYPNQIAYYIVYVIIIHSHDQANPICKLVP